MHQKSTALEYSADYRTAERQANKVTIKATAKPKSSHAEAHLEGAFPTNVDTISTSMPTTRKIGLYKVVFACVMFALAIAGVMALFSALSRTTAVMGNLLTNAKRESYVSPMVMHDSPPFEDCKVAERIWQNLFQKTVSPYKELDAKGLTLIPASDVQNVCTELFGPNATINTSESVRGQFFNHTAGDDNFHISSTSNADRFVPHIDDITEDNDDLSLAVSYLVREDKLP